MSEKDFIFKPSLPAASVGFYKYDVLNDLWESTEGLNLIFGINKNYRKNYQTWLDLVHPDDKEMMDRYLKEEIISKHEAFNKEYRITRNNDGETIWVQGMGETSTDIEGNVVSIQGTIQDITERKQIEESLHRIEKELNEAQRIAHIGSWYLDIASNQINWSDELYKMYGFDSAQPVPPLTESAKLFVPQSWKQLSDAIAYCGETGTPYELELQTVKKDGSQGWMLARGEAVRDKHGKIVGLRGVAQDITVRKKTEDSIKLAASVFTNAREGIAIVDPVGIIIDVNESFALISGYSREESVGQNLSILITPQEEPEFYAELWKSLKDESYWSGEFSSKR